MGDGKLKTLFLNGSPRKSGDTVTLIKEMEKYLDGDVERLSAYHDRINPCIDCRCCWKNPGCIYDDAVQRVIEGLDGYDNVVIASPLYFSELTGALLSMCSRFQQMYTARRFRGMAKRTTAKNGVLILAGGGDGTFESAQKTAKILFGQLNANYLGMVLTANTNTVSAKEDERAMRKAKEMALLLNELYYDKSRIGGIGAAGT